MEWMKKNQERICILVGLAAMVATVIPNFILGEHAIFDYHDQLDGEVIAYILQAKHLFENGGLPEFMGGMPKTALVMPAPIFVLLFVWGEYVLALTLMLLIGRIVGFVGMYLLARECTGNVPAALIVGGMYGLLPFQPVYGISQFGIPLLIWCALRLRQGKKVLWCYLYVALYAFGSSLVLVGFAFLGVGCAWILWEFFCRKKGENGKRRLFHACAAVMLLLLIYLLGNGDLLAQVLGSGEATVSHKTEYEISALAFGHTFKEYMLYGIQHSHSYHRLMIPVGMLSATIGFVAIVCKRTGSIWERVAGALAEDSQLHKVLISAVLCLAGNVILGLIAASWNSEVFVNVRNNLGALKAFHFERILWMAPCLWYLLMACLMTPVLKCVKSTMKLWGKMVSFLACGVIALSLVVTVGQIVFDGDLKSNIQKLRNPEYGILSFYEYYAIGVMEQVEAFLRETTGMEQEEYRVASLGIDPAAALYHGFYSVDGYSNNYDVTYKHAFREVIAPELAKSEYLRDYYDDWGNRCYLFSAECPGYYTIEKNGFYFREYELNAKALKEMGCDYILSAAYIADGEKQGLELMNEVPFETEDSYYSIYVYEIND